MKRKNCVTSGSNVTRDVLWCVTVDYQQRENDNIANQIHGFTIDYGKFILKRDIKNAWFGYGLAFRPDWSGNASHFTPVFTTLYYMATIVRAHWLAAERAYFLVMTGQYEIFSRLDGSFELWVKLRARGRKQQKRWTKYNYTFNNWKKN